jgi:DNA-binding MarR family transcriptional regulator
MTALDDADPCWVIARLARTIENSLSDLELSLSQYRVLTILARNSEGAAALAAKLAVKPASVTSVVDGLVARGLVERQAHADDRRKVTHVVSASGSALLDQARERAAERLREVSAHLEPDDEATAWASLELWHRGLSAYRASRQADGLIAR